MSDARAHAILKRFYGKPQELAVYLTKIRICQAKLVFEVFALLNRYSRVDVGVRFLNILSPASLFQLLASGDGQFLGQLLEDSLMDYKLQPGAYRDGIPSLSNGRFENLRYAVGNSPFLKEEIRAPRKLSECEIDYYINYGKTSRFISAWKRKVFDKDISWQLPRRGVGYVVYNPDDLADANPKRKRKLRDRYGYDQIGTKETVSAMIKIAKKWHSKYPNKPLQYGDISRHGGIDTPDHSTHEDGKAFDMRPLRKDNNLGPLTYNSRIYSRKLTKDLILIVRGLFSGTRFLFNDNQLNAQDRSTRTFVNPAKGHNNHLHIIFAGGI